MDLGQDRDRGLDPFTPIWPCVLQVYKVSKFPAILLFKRSKPVLYNGAFKANDINTHIRTVEVVQKDGSKVYMEDEGLFDDQMLVGDDGARFMSQMMQQAEWDESSDLETAHEEPKAAEEPPGSLGASDGKADGNAQPKKEL